MDVRSLRVSNYFRDTSEDGGVFQAESIMAPGDGYGDYSVVYRKGSMRTSLESDKEPDQRVLQPVKLDASWLKMLKFTEYSEVIDGVKNYDYEYVTDSGSVLYCEWELDGELDYVSIIDTNVEIRDVHHLQNVIQDLS